MKIIEKTKHYCITCNKAHDAKIIKNKNQILFRFKCKNKLYSNIISNDADLFIKNRIYYIKNIPIDKYKWISLINITDACNFNCPICYASIKRSGNEKYLSTDEIIKRVKPLNNSPSVFLTGGEPTLHPDLVNIVSSLKKIGKKVYLVSNGYKLGKDSELVKKLKKAGLLGVGIQFDTFDKKIHKIMRNNSHIKTKLKAISNCISVRLLCNIVTCVFNKNISHVADILEYVKNESCKISKIKFQCLINTGRKNVSNEIIITKEDIVNEIIKSNIFPEVSKDSFFPYPIYKPWHLNVHPDCSTLLLIFKYKNRFIPLNKLCQIDKLFKLMSKNNMKRNFWSNNVVMTYYLFKTCNLKSFYIIFLSLVGFLIRNKKFGLFLISADQYMDKDYKDINRINRCPTQMNKINYKDFVSPCKIVGIK